jgi:hypothetical protein
VSGGLACRCDGTEEERRARWHVTHRHHNHSAFNGYRRTESPTSEVVCVECRGRWRTRAAYVAELQGECLGASS